MKRYYQVSCLKCKHKFRWDRLNPKPCKCGSYQGVYKKHNVTLRAAKEQKDD